MTGIHAARTNDARSPLWMPGATLGGIAAAAMHGPTLFPKDPKLQRIGIAAAGLIGLGVGTGVEGIARGLDDVVPGDHLASQLTVAGAGAAVAAATALASRGHATGGAALAQTGGILLAAGGTIGAAGSLAARADAEFPGPDALAQSGLVVAAGGAVLGIASHNLAAARSIPRVLPDLPELAATRATFGDLAVDHGLDVRGALTSGGSDSLVPVATLPAPGRRFLSEMPSAAEIGSVMGTTGAKEPIRAYVGLDSVPATLDEATAVARRADLMVRELDRLGTFGRHEIAADGSLRVLEQPRASLLVVAPTSTGFVNPVAASSYEFLHNGDTAVATIQVARKKSGGEIHHVLRATATHQAFLERLAAHLDALPEGMPKPTVHAYGESFGAWASQNGLLGTGEGTVGLLAKRLGHWNGANRWQSEGGLSRMDRLHVDKAMYTGTPKFSQFRPKLLADAALVGGDQPAVLTVRDLESTKAVSAEHAAKARITFLQHDADPVGLFHPKLLWEHPVWLGARTARGQNVPPQQRWMPIVTGLQTVLDQQNAQFFTAGTLEAKGHDYRSEVTYVMRRAFNTPDVTDTQVARVREWNRQLEEIHVEHEAAAAAAASAG